MAELIFDKTETGKRLKSVRKALKLSLAIVGQEARISPSVVSENENGKKIPNSQYLIYLLLKHDANLNYIIKGEGEMFLNKKGRLLNELDFGNNQNIVEEMLQVMKYFPDMMYTIFSVYSKLKRDNRDELISFFNKEEIQAANH